MKTLITTILCLLSTALSGQRYFESKWTTGNIDYTAFIIIFHEKNILVNVGYKIEGDYKVAQYRAVLENSEGKFSKIINGSNAEIVHGPTNTGYIADNFYVVTDENDSIDEVYVKDDQSADIEIQKTVFRELDKSKDLTLAYILQFHAPETWEYGFLINYDRDITFE